MGKKLIITEKPSVAQEFARVLHVSGVYRVNWPLKLLKRQNVKAASSLMAIRRTIIPTSWKNIAK